MGLTSRGGGNPKERRLAAGAGVSDQIGWERREEAPPLQRRDGKATRAASAAARTREGRGTYLDVRDGGGQSRRRLLSG